MPDTDRTLLPVPPRLIISRPADEAANINLSSHQDSKLATRRRVTGPSPASFKDSGRGRSSEWIDVDDETRPRRRRKSKRTIPNGQDKHRPSKKNQPSQRTSTTDFGRFFPKLSQILESNEPTSTPRSSTRSSDVGRHSNRNSSRRSKNRDDASVIYRRPVHKVGGNQRRTESVLQINPSLLSVLSGLTSTSDRSSGSNSTITQRSYDRRGSDSSRTPMGRPHRPPSDVGSTVSGSRTGGARTPNVFDYMQAPSVDDGHDDQSVFSSSSSSVSSHYQPSDAGSSEAPATPSSRSSIPSPTHPRGSSVAELRRKYDLQHVASVASSSNGEHSPRASIRSLRKQPSVSDVAEDEDEEEDADDSVLASEVSDSTSRRQSDSLSEQEKHLRQREEYLRQQMAYAQQAQDSYWMKHNPDQHRSPSMSSSASENAAHAYHHMAMQHYQCPSPPMNLAQPPSPHSPVGNPAQQDPPPVPDAPDLTQRTITGYEQIALELASSTSPIQPLYRKFTYLNHRILLHLQDELSELEEQLRTVDEIIAQLDPAFKAESQELVERQIDNQTQVQTQAQTQSSAPRAAHHHRMPSSRRGEAYQGLEIHHRRTSLLGRIFLKTEQYNKAMTSYASMLKDTSPAGPEEIAPYRAWMAENTPLHEIETRFLHHAEDLVVPAGTSQPQQKTSNSSIPSTPATPSATSTLPHLLPLGLMLPLLLFAVIPTVAGRLLVTTLIATAAFIVTATTGLRRLLPLREWAVCGAAYLLLMGAIAGCIPQH